MGWTHYWTQTRSFKKTEWKEVLEDIKTITKFAQHERGIVLAGGFGEDGTSHQFTDDTILFNGLGDDAHETFEVNRAISKVVEYPGHNPAWNFCKTAHKPYDVVVTACLCYLSSITETHSVSSDGNGNDFVQGLQLAKNAIPRLANQLDIPMGIMEDDRWCAPWISHQGKTYNVRFCVDGKGYVLKGKESYCFETHEALASWLDQNKVVKFKSGGTTSWGAYGNTETDIWRAYGSFDKKRLSRITAAQNKKLATLFPVPSEHAIQPPAFVRPGQMPENAGRKFCYSITDLLNLQSAA